MTYFLSGTSSGWPFLLLLEAIPAITSLCILPFLPESPRYLLLINGDRDNAEKGNIFNPHNYSYLGREYMYIYEYRRPIKTIMMIIIRVGAILFRTAVYTYTMISRQNTAAIRHFCWTSPHLYYVLLR